MASTSALKVKQGFAVGFSDQEIQNDLTVPVSPAQVPIAVAQQKSKWVELPDCKSTLTDDDVPLKDDLSNAIIATCKSYKPAATGEGDASGDDSAPTETPEQIYQKQWKNDYTHWQAGPIYDAVIKTSKSLSDHEHQVTQHEHGHVDPTTGENGPHGDWYMHGKPVGGDEWPKPTIDPALVQIYRNAEDPTDIQVIQLKNEIKK